MVDFEFYGIGRKVIPIKGKDPKDALLRWLRPRTVTRAGRIAEKLLVIGPDGTNTTFGTEEILREAWHPDIEWRYQIGSKTMPSHAYLVNTDHPDPKNRPSACGDGPLWRVTKLEWTASPKRKYPIGRCTRCCAIASSLGMVKQYRPQRRPT